MKPQTDSIACVSTALPPEAADALLELINCDSGTPTVWHDIERNTCRVTVFPHTPAQLDACGAALTAAAALLGHQVTPHYSRIAREDWAESWKRFFQVERVSERVVVRPSWEDYTPQPGDCVITLDPGLSFGTGRHATTKACLQLLDRLSAEDPRRSVLDMGCGSGILAIAASLLGFAPVRGFDNDPDCIRHSEENAALNRVTLPFHLDDLSHAHPVADIVVANILANVLVEHAPQVAGSLAPGPRSLLILSGILDEQYPSVRAAYEREGLRELDTLLIENWRSGLWGNR